MVVNFYLEADIDAEDLLKVSNRLKNKLKVLNKPEEGIVSILKIESETRLDESEIFSLILDFKVLDIFVDFYEIN